MTVRAKFYCTECVQRHNGYQVRPGGHVPEPAYAYAYKFSPVIPSTVENASFFEATPAGSIELQVVKPGTFEVGRTYYVDFTPAEEAAQ